MLSEIRRNTPDICLRQRGQRYLFAQVLVALLLILTASCGVSGGDSNATASGGKSTTYGSIVVDSDRIFTFADFESAGVKHGKDYNIEGLPGAVGASLGFYNAKDIELRFFPSHETAVDQGISIVREVVGSDVLIKRENVTWTWGTADEKACSARVPGGGRDCTKSPKYGDFVVYGNVIMLCEAANADEGRALCQKIIDGLPGS